ncbi:peptidoglycan-binding domain-containing protein [Thermocoleostomius sinensis]|uniref:Peptidoglycan-binding protein n=1 Tax=Thermocoleostomius sinensis A174 TaxID=2016057 RepID=A0A9E8ZJT5_9CYAN|nr:peptidoglycan-binding protein [Thermocoleostomius sinensis]WAL62528.1 peptidoglycan-binding protein [Thermocoleostomius sinensis A174]
MILVPSLYQSKCQPSFRLGCGFDYVLMLGAFMVVCAASFTMSDGVQAQTGPYPPQREVGYGGEPTINLQRRLSELGYYNGEISGYYGPQTHDAVIRFQQDMGLEPDGIVGPATARALAEWGGSPRSIDEPSGGEPITNRSVAQNTIQLNDEGEQVAELQQRLAELGYYNGDFSGVFDYATEAAVMQFQRNNGLEADGIVGPSTEDTLRRPSEEIQQPIAPSEATREPTDPQASHSTFSSGETVAQGNLLRIGDSGQAVSELQTRLQALGYYQGAVTGTYDATTTAAVIAFQQAQGLTIDGIAGPQVNSALYNPNLYNPNNVVAMTPTSTDPITTPLPDPNATIPGTTVPNVVAMPTSVVPTVPTMPIPTNPQPGLQPPQPQLETQQAQLVLNQNLDEGRYSVAELQRRLRDEGLYSGEISGMMTAETQAAIVAAQRKHGLSPSDLLDTASN